MQKIISSRSEIVGGRVRLHLVVEVDPLKIDVRKTLTARERTILPLLLEGLSHKEIADRVQLTERASKFHSCNIYRKYSVTSRTELMRDALVSAEG